MGGGSGHRAEPGAQLSRRRLWLALGWVMVLLVIYFSLTPKPPAVGAGFGDKAQHLTAYFTLMFWFAQLHVRRLYVALWVFALGALLEIAQGLTGYREASALDLAADTLGIVLGWSAARLMSNVPARLEGLWP